MQYIKDKKKEFTEVRENRRNLSYEKKQVALTELQERRKKEEGRLKIDQSYEREESKLRDVRKKQIKRGTIGKGLSFGGMVMRNLKNSRSKNKSSVWNSLGASNPFSSEKTVKIKKRRRKIVIYE